MPIVDALTRAKTYLLLPEGEAVDLKVANAETPARSVFEQSYYLYNKVKLIGDGFSSVSIVKYNDDFVKVEVSKAVSKRLFNGYELSVESGNYQDRYTIQQLDRTNKTFLIEAEFFDEQIDFINLEYQIYEDALAWLICYMTRFTLQEIQANNILITSSQLGNGNIQSYSVNSIKQFQRQLLNNYNNTLGYRSFPVGN